MPVPIMTLLGFIWCQWAVFYCYIYKCKCYNVIYKWRSVAVVFLYTLLVPSHNNPQSGHIFFCIVLFTTILTFHLVVANVQQEAKVSKLSVFTGYSSWETHSRYVPSSISSWLFQDSPPTGIHHNNHRQTCITDSPSCVQPPNCPSECQVMFSASM